MVHPVVSERGLLIDTSEREFKNAVRMLRSFPPLRLDEKPADCRFSARQLAWAFVERERLMHYAIRGRAAGPGSGAPSSLPEILAAYEEAHFALHLRAALLNDSVGQTEGVPALQPGA